MTKVESGSPDFKALSVAKKSAHLYDSKDFSPEAFGN